MCTNNIIATTATNSTTSNNLTSTISSNILSYDQLISRHYSFLSLFPCPIPHDVWSNVATSLLQSIQHEKLLMSRLDGGTYIALKDAYILERDISNSIGSGVGSNSMNGVVVHKEDVLKDGIEEMLLAEGLPIVRTSTHVHRALLSMIDGGNDVVAGEVNPKLVRALFNMISENNQFHPFVSSNLSQSPLRTSSTLASSSSSQPLLHLIKNRSKIILTDMTRKRIVFLLQYCTSDLSLNVDSLSQLIGVSLLPLEDDSLGIIQGATDAEPYLLVNDVERKLLINAGSNIVASDSILGQSVANLLREEKFSEVCSVRSITVIDVLKLICKYILPKQWLVATNALVNITDILTTDWLISLWSYIIEMKCIEIFKDVVPLIPVVSPANLPEGCYLTKCSLNIPILHMAYHDIEKDAVIALSDLGIFIFNPSVLGSKSYSLELTRLISPSSPKGVLNCIVSRIKALIPLDDTKPYVVNAFLDGIVSADRKVRSALQSFILDHIISKLSVELTAIEIYALASLPIWSTCNARVIDGENNELNNNIYAVLDFDKHHLYPKAIESCFLNSSYIYLRDEHDRSSYIKLGIHQASMGLFLANNVIPLFMNIKTDNQSLSFISDEKIDNLVQKILRNLPKLEREYNGFMNLLSNCPIFRCSDSNHPTLHQISSLYDPEVLLLKSFIPSHLFPSTTLTNDPLVLDALRTLGLKNSLNSDDVLSIASDIQAEMDRHAVEYDAANALLSNTASYSSLSSSTIANGNQKSSSSSLPTTSSTLTIDIEQKVTTRASKLLEYLEFNVERLLKDFSPESLQAYKNNRTGTVDDTNGKDEPRINSTDLSLGGKWAEELRLIRWIPVCMQPPSILQSNQINVLPWPSRVHCRPLASPSQCNCLHDLWLCSSTTRICTVKVKSELLLALLGWNRPISGENK